MYRAIICLAALSCFSPPAAAYSVLTHQAIIDAAWDQSIQPLLLQRYPAATPEAMKRAHAYAYAGCIFQDMGYYPFGSKFFSDLVHYVRSGDFLINLLMEARDLNEYAFALGGVAHYAADTQGHSIAVNRAVPIEYEELRRKYGDVVTYQDKPGAHLKVEFAFDVLQVSRGNYAPQSYRDFIGFEVAKEALERAFHRTYSLELKDVFANVDLALATYRRSIGTVIPTITRAAWALKKDELERRGVSRREFIYNLSEASYRKEWSEPYRKPGIGSRILAFLLRLLPRVGPLRALSFKPPSVQTQQLFEESFNRTLSLYRDLLRDHGSARLRLENRDFDTGAITRPTEYKKADETYAKLAIKLAEKRSGAVDPAIRDDILAYYHDPELPYGTKKDKKEWKRTLEAVAKLKLGAAASAREQPGAVQINRPGGRQSRIY